MGSILFKCAVTDLFIQWVLWAVTVILRTEKLHDLAGPGTFIILTHLSCKWNGTRYLRQRVQGALITTQGLRVGLFLFLKVFQGSQYRRINQVRNNAKRLFVYWFIQGIWIYITLLPTLILNTQKRDTPLCARDFIGWTIWAIGFILETMADQQMWNFKNNVKNADKFIQHGLWAYSQHPNYLGKMLCWTGLFISASSVMKRMEYTSILSPVFLWFFLTHISGISILEKEALKKWGHDPAYLEYVRRTPRLWQFRF